MAIFTPEQLKQKIAMQPVAAPTAVTPLEQKPETPGFLERLGQDFAKRTASVEKSKQTQPLAQALLHTTGEAAGLIGDVTGEAIKSVALTGFDALPENVQSSVKEGAKSAASYIVGTPVGKLGIEALKSGADAYNQFAEVHPDAAQAIGDVFNIASIIPIGKAAKVGTEAAGTVTETALKKAASTAQTVATAAKPAVTGIKNITQAAGGGIARTPSRIATNVAERSAQAQAINKLPTVIAKRAAQDGVDVQDVKYIYSLPKDQKAPLKKLVDIVQKFDRGETKTNPIEIVGQPIVNRIKELESSASKIGTKLGAVANKLGTVTKEEVTGPVFSALKKVSGLAGLKTTPTGALDFSDTVLASALSKTDRTAIQRIFNEAVSSGTGKQKHLLRQELFENLGGKKKSLAGITDTQEKAYNAIRKGLSDVLEAKNSQYKALSNDYRKVKQPLQEMGKFMKSVSGADEDLKNMSAGLLARRLTSNAASNPQIRSILRSMDAATKKPGKARINVENLQDFYNVLDRYYDISGKTTLQGQIKAGVEKVGFQEAIIGAIKETAGKTKTVQRAALEKALREVLK